MKKFDLDSEKAKINMILDRIKLQLRDIRGGIRAGANAKGLKDYGPNPMTIYLLLHFLGY